MNEHDGEDGADKQVPGTELEPAVRALLTVGEEATLAALAPCLTPTEVAVVAISGRLGDEASLAARDKALRHLRRCRQCRARLTERLISQKQLVIDVRDFGSRRAHAMSADEAELLRSVARSLVLACRHRAEAVTPLAVLGRGVERGPAGKPEELVATVPTASCSEWEEAPPPIATVRMRAIEGPIIRDHGMFVLEVEFAPGQDGAAEYRRDRAVGRGYSLVVAIRSGEAEVRLLPAEINERGHALVASDLRHLNVADGLLRTQDLSLEIWPLESAK